MHSYDEGAASSAKTDMIIGNEPWRKLLQVICAAEGLKPQNPPTRVADFPTISHEMALAVIHNGTDQRSRFKMMGMYAAYCLPKPIIAIIRGYTWITKTLTYRC